MKYMKIVIIVFLSFSISMISCKKDDNSDTDDTNPTGGESKGMTAKINDKNFIASSDASARYIMGTLIISGYSNTEQIQLTLYNTNAETGDFMIDDMTNYTNTGIYIHSQNTDENFYTYMGNGSGEVSLDEFTNSRVKGSFYFTAGNSNGESVSITDGTFDMALVQTEN